MKAIGSRGGCSGPTSIASTPPIFARQEVGVEQESRSTAIAGTGGIALGVFWYAWGKVGFWWALLYGIGWPVWAGFKMAEVLNLGGK